MQTYQFVVGGADSAEADKLRRRMGAISYLIGVSAFVAGALWAAATIGGALNLAYLGNLKFSTSLAAVFAAKAVWFAAVETFAIAMVRTAERLTMPMSNYLQLVEAESNAKAKAGDADKALDLIKKVVDLVKEGTEIATKAGK